MAYVAVEADERLEEGPEGLEFKSFLGTDARGDQRTQSTPSNLDRGYLTDHTTRKGPSGFWTVDYYQPYFDVDTATVLKRCYTTLLPTSSSYLTVLTPSADLYGPFWVPTTLILALFLSSSLAASISSYLSAEGAAYEYNFGLLSLAATIVYAYAFAVPVLLWLALRYIGVGEWGVAEALGVWGYSLFVWVPVSILCVIPVPLLRWVLVGIAFSLSGYFLVANVYPILTMADAKATRLLIIAVGALHAGLALTFKVLFFSYYVVHEIGPGTDPVP
ncbi:Yip1-domain-containing protein [Rhizopogon salebrosus TDB-379]|nr:Yip1-domain-containing protein [Rhizopogon salebrosus TDB-379]